MDQLQNSYKENRWEPQGQKSGVSKNRVFQSFLSSLVETPDVPDL